MTDSNLNIKVTAQNQASATLQKVRQDVSRLDGAAANASNGLGALAAAAGVAGLAALAASAAQVTVELAQLGAQSLAMKSSFENVQGGAQNATLILESLRVTSRGMISDYDLMLTANRAALLGVADTAEEMSALMQIAAVRGRAMGLSTTQAFNDIVTGLGRMSPLILDNLGIVVNQEKAQKAYAEQIGKSADALTDAEQKQALVNAVMQESAGLLAGANAEAENLAGSGMTQLTTAWQNFRTAIGESIAPLLDQRAREIASFIGAAQDNLDQFNELEALRARLQNAGAGNTAGALAGITDPAMQKEILSDVGGAELSALGDSVRRVLASYQQSIDTFIAASKAGNSELVQSAKNNMEDYGAALMGVATQYNALAEILGQPVFDLDLLSIGEIKEIGDYQQIIPLFTGMGQAASQAVAGIDPLAESMEQAAQVVSDAEPKIKRLYDTLLDSGKIEESSAAYDTIKSAVTDIVAEWVQAGVPIEEINSTLLPKLIAELNTVIATQIEAGATGQSAGEAIGSGFLAAIPGIAQVIAAVEALIGVSGEASAAVGNAASRFNLHSWQWKDFNATGVRPPGLIGPAPRGVEKPPAQSPLNPPSFGWFGASADEFGGKTRADLERARIAAMAEARRYAQRTSLSGGGGGGGGSVDTQIDQLSGRIKSVLQGALSSGIDLGSILGREDAVEEPARRLADIAVRGFESPWVDYIRNTFPEIWDQISTAGDPKAAAAGILKDFEAGLRPELLDKARAKELVKRALLGDSNMTALANEIAAELAAEMGISMQQAQAAAAGVLGGGGGSDGLGAAFGDGVVTGISNSNVGSNAVSTLVGQLKLKDNVDAVYAVGESHAVVYGNGFLAAIATNIPGGLIAALVAAVTPGVIAQTLAANSRTGAAGSTGAAGGAI